MLGFERGSARANASVRSLDLQVACSAGKTNQPVLMRLKVLARAVNGQPKRLRPQGRPGRLSVAFPAGDFRFVSVPIERAQQ